MATSFGTWTRSCGTWGEGNQLWERGGDEMVMKKLCPTSTSIYLILSMGVTSVILLAPHCSHERGMKAGPKATLSKVYDQYPPCLFRCDMMRWTSNTIKT